LVLQVAGISWLERKGAAALYAAPPESSFDEALQNFMKTEEIKPDQWKANMLMIAKVHFTYTCCDETLSSKW